MCVAYVNLFFYLFFIFYQIWRITAGPIDSGKRVKYKEFIGSNKGKRHLKPNTSDEEWAPGIRRCPPGTITAYSPTDTILQSNISYTARPSQSFSDFATHKVRKVVASCPKDHDNPLNFYGIVEWKPITKKVQRDWQKTDPILQKEVKCDERPIRPMSAKKFHSDVGAVIVGIPKRGGNIEVSFSSFA